MVFDLSHIRFIRNRDISCINNVPSAPTFSKIVERRLSFSQPDCVNTIVITEHDCS